MPITKWYCQTCKAEVPIDHYATSVCGETLVHPDYAAAIIGDRDSQHIKGAVRVTHGLGCPRRAVIEHVEDYAVDPLEMNAMLTGTAWHAMMERFGDEQGCEVSVGGNLAGVSVAGRADRIRDMQGGVAVEDHKHVNDPKYVKKDGVKPEHVAQLSIYAELAEQSGRNRPTRGIIWHHTSKSGADALIPIKVELMPVNDVLEFRPHQGDYTVAELYQQADDGFRTLNWRAMPMAGASMSLGAHTMCNYCSVRGICKTAETGAPF